MDREEPWLWRVLELLHHFFFLLAHPFTLKTGFSFGYQSVYSTKLILMRKPGFRFMSQYWSPRISRSRINIIVYPTGSDRDATPSSCKRTLTKIYYNSHMIIILI